MRLLQAYHFLLLVIFLSLKAATSVAVPKYAKPGCNDTCGKVRIPYPFGIGAKCSVNKWYNIDCNSSTPYISALNHLEVLGVDLGNQTVTVNMPKVCNCSLTKSVDLGSSPFIFSKTHNRFVYEGYCGNAVMMDDEGSFVTGCSTTCSNDSTSVTLYRNNKCLGIKCCETTIPHYLKSYGLNLTGLERQLGGDGACGSAFLVDQSAYDEGRFSGNSFIPTSLLWTLGDLDLKQVNCCNTGYSYMDYRTVDLSNGTSVDTFKCWSNIKPLNGNPYLFDGCYDFDTEECARCQGNGRGYCSYRRINDVDGLFNKWNFNCYPHSRSHRHLVLIAIGNAYFPGL